MDDAERRQLYRRAVNTDAGHQMLADILGRAGVHRVDIPHDATGAVDALALARQEGARQLALEIMGLAGVEFRLEFPPLAETKRPTDIETE